MTKREVREHLEARPQMLEDLRKAIAIDDLFRCTGQRIVLGIVEAICLQDSIDNYKLTEGVLHCRY